LLVIIMYVTVTEDNDSEHYFEPRIDEEAEKLEELHNEKC